MNPGDFMKNFPRFSAEAATRAGPLHKRRRQNLFEQATLGFTPDALTLPAAHSRKVAHYTGKRAKGEKGKRGNG